jgi:hypothetical protein
MKIYTEVVIDISTGETVSEESFEYEGPLALADSGGGGSSGASDWPEYMKEIHEEWLDDLNDVEIPAMILSNPFTGAVSFDPNAELTIAWDAVCEFDAFVDGMTHETDWESAITKATTVIDALIIDDTYIDADIQAFGDLLDDELNTDVLPQFKAGMRNINAVMTSAFVLGEADIYAKRNRDVAKFGTEARGRLNLQRNDMVLKSVERILGNLLETAKLEGEVARLSVDAKRISIVAQKEESDMNLEIGENDGRWNMEAYVYGQNMLAGISGGTRGSGGSKPSAGQSALSGALSGASMGMATGNPYAAVAGGIIGGIGGYLYAS